MRQNLVGNMFLFGAGGKEKSLSAFSGFGIKVDVSF
jgi:hypothetical protein